MGRSILIAGELEREANAYKELAGFDLATLQALSHDRSPT